MGMDAEKLRVLIPTTNGVVEVLLLTEEDPAIGRCVACIGGTTETADIATAYHAFVVRPTGVVESLFGHPCYRLDVSGRIDAGSSWQLGVLAAHALHAVGRLAEENEPAGGVIWATGSVRPVDLTVGGVSHVPEKVANSIDRLKQEAAAGRRVLMAIPDQNASTLSADVGTDLAAHGIEVLALTRVQSLWDKLAVKLPEGPRRYAGTPAPPSGVRVLVRPRKWYIWGAAAVALLTIVSGTASIYAGAIYLLGRQPTIVANPGPAFPPPAQGKLGALVPELVPFITERDREAIRDVYMSAPDHKAISISFANMTFVSAQPDKDTAETAAVAKCRSLVDESRLGRGRGCELYASGNVVTSTRGRPPMPPQPWIIRDPSVETPLAATDVPLITDGNNRRFLERMLDSRNSTKVWRWKALAISVTGGWFSMGSDTSLDEAVRKSLEWCGYSAGAACMVVAVGDNFVVPIPRTMKVVGFARSGPINAVAPELRDDVARRLGNATSGWSAVAVGASGRVGIKLGAESEQAAIDGSMEACGRQDRDCRVAVLGPFLVERGL